MDDVEIMCMQCGGYVDDVEVMCMLCGGCVDDVTPHCGVSTCPHLHIKRIPVIPCLQSYFSQTDTKHLKPHRDNSNRL